ncbi:hypothetical protein FRC10_002149 [Ceratobasidium sp. 414]|nr:hypothetical protein FRC10_002149 [Ceratobasidium sp. 414]
MGRPPKRKLAFRANAAVASQSKKRRIEEPKAEVKYEELRSSIKVEDSLLALDNLRDVQEEIENRTTHELEHEHELNGCRSPNVAHVPAKPDTSREPENKDSIEGSSNEKETSMKTHTITLKAADIRFTAGEFLAVLKDMQIDAEKRGEQPSSDTISSKEEQVKVPTIMTPEPFQNAPLTIDAASDALQKIDNILRPPRASGSGHKPSKLDDEILIRRLHAMVGCLRLYCSEDLDWTFTRASEIAAIASGYGQRFGKQLRRFIRAFISTGDTPSHSFGAHNTSALKNEHLASAIKFHLEVKGQHATANDIVQYLGIPLVQAQLNIGKAPCVRTAQRWMKDLGYSWGLAPKGQYTDGHEREDVVHYRNFRFIPVWSRLEKRMRSYDSKTMQEHLPTLRPGEKEVMVEDNARIVMLPGKSRDGYLTNERIRSQLTQAIGIVKAKYPNAEHVFVFDNATTHTKKREDIANPLKMTLGPSNNIGDVASLGADGRKLRVRMEGARFADGSQQDLYYPLDHAKYPGYFKGLTEILRERGIVIPGLKLQCTGKNRRILSDEPDFVDHKSALEELAEAHECQVLFLPKFHCELNPIEQCWGYAKQVYRQLPPSKSEADLRTNMLLSLSSVPLDSIRRFFNKSQRYTDAYQHGLTGQEAAWANKKYRSHRMLPPNIREEIDAEVRRQASCSNMQPTKK